MDPSTFLKTVVDPTLKWLPTIGVVTPAGNKPRAMLMPIAGQESGWTARRQGGGGPARGKWQFEGGSMSGLAEVLRVASKEVKLICQALDIPGDQATLFEALAWNDTLACSLARLLLWSDPAPLPELGDEEGAWQYYLSNWHPGTPHRELWTDVYSTSLNLVKANPL